MTEKYKLVDLNQQKTLAATVESIKKQIEDAVGETLTNMQENPNAWRLGFWGSRYTIGGVKVPEGIYQISYADTCEAVYAILCDKVAESESCWYPLRLFFCWLLGMAQSEQTLETYKDYKKKLDRFFEEDPAAEESTCGWC